MTNEIEKTNDTRTLAQRATARKVQIKDACLILDISSSMGIEIEPGERRIDALRKIVSDIHGNVTTIVFNDNARVVDKNDIPEPFGYTYMSRAFQLAKDQGFKSAILITDGEASDKALALQAVDSLNVRIIYVGSGDKPDFLNDLATRAGSFCTKEDLKMPKELSNKIQLLLGTSEDKGAICL